MTFLIDVYGAVDHRELNERFEAYRAYLASVKASMPRSAWDFAAAPWHYDVADPRCPHDAWVESVTIRELSSGERQECRTLWIEVRLLGASHNGFLGLVYHEVQAYVMQQPLRGPTGPVASVAHGD